MRSVSAAALIFSCVASIASAAPTGAFTFDNDPLHNGFPNPSPDQIIKIEQAAHGSLPIAAAAAKNATSKAPSADTVSLILPMMSVLLRGDPWSNILTWLCRQ